MASSTGRVGPSRESDGRSRLIIDSEHKLRSENLPFDIDVWYPRLRKHTYRTVFLPLTRREAESLMRHYRTAYLGRAELTPNDVQTLSQLESSLDSTIQKHFPRSGAFLRLCGRSPKDGDPADRGAVWREYTRCVDALVANGAPRNDAHTKLRAIGRVNGHFRVASGGDAMSLLCSSERVFTDLNDWMRHGEPEQVVLREFDPRVALIYEFRAFVCCGRLTAVSQYDHYAVYPSLKPHVDCIRALIAAEWRKIHSDIGVPSYCADFCYFPNEKRVRLIEISPFLPCTGPACFDWSKDGALLKGETVTSETVTSETVKGETVAGSDQKQKLELRLNTSLKPGMDELLEVNWESRWDPKQTPLLGTQPRPYRGVWTEAKRRWAAKTAVTKRNRRFCLAKKAAVAALITVSIAALIRRLRSVSLRASYLGALTTLLSWMAWRRTPRTDKAHARTPPFAPLTIPLFVYGTLKKGFHWHDKFLKRRSSRVGVCETRSKYPLVVGASGVPYCLGDCKGRGHCVRGELYMVDQETLQGLDDYEGLGKGHYIRVRVPVRPLSNESNAWPPDAEMYVKAESSSELRALKPFKEYTRTMHRERYHAIKHIQVKQQMYLSEFYGERFAVDEAMG